MIKKILFISLVLQANISLCKKELPIKLAFVQLYGPIEEAEEVIMNLFNASQDDDISGIVLLMNSPGGSASASSAIRELIMNIKEIKPIITLVMGQCASGGYLIASATDYIVAPAMADIGSIGVVMSFGKYKNPQIRSEIHADLEQITLTAGKYKALTNPFAEMTDENTKALQESIDYTYDLFCSQVAECRKLDLSKRNEWAEAKIFTGKEAKKVGLIDELGSIIEAQKAMLRLLNKTHKNNCDETPEVSIVFFKQEDKKNSPEWSIMPKTLLI